MRGKGKGEDCEPAAPLPSGKNRQMPSTECGISVPTGRLPLGQVYRPNYFTATGRSAVNDTALPSIRIREAWPLLVARMLSVSVRP